MYIVHYITLRNITSSKERTNVIDKVRNALFDMIGLFSVRKR